LPKQASFIISLHVLSHVGKIFADITKIKNDIAGLIPISSSEVMCPNGQTLNVLGECESLIQVKTNIPSKRSYDDSKILASFQTVVMDSQNDVPFQTASGQPTPVAFNPTELSKVQGLINDIGTVKTDIGKIRGVIDSISLPSGGTCPTGTIEILGTCTAPVKLECDPDAPLFLGICTGAPSSNCPTGTSDPDKTGICSGEPDRSCPPRTSDPDKTGVCTGSPTLSCPDSTWDLKTNSLGTKECQRNETTKKTPFEVNPCAIVGISCGDCSTCFTDFIVDNHFCSSGSHDATNHKCVLTPTATCHPDAPNVVGTCTGFASLRCPSTGQTGVAICLDNPISRTCPLNTSDPDNTGICTGDPGRICPPDTTDNGAICRATPT